MGALAARIRPLLMGHPVDLAVFRVVVALLLLTSAEVHDAPRFADGPWGALARVGVCLGALLGLLGVRARLGFALAAVCALYLLGLPHTAGVGLHNHHLVWFAALLASSPCADALAWGRSGRPPPSARHGVPLRAAWLILGAIYLWPGVWKLAAVGFDWAAAENLRRHLHWKWAQSWDFEPLFRLDRMPALLTVGGWGVLLFELSAPLLMLFRRTRGWALAGGLLFHGFTAALFDIRFGSLWPCLAVLVPWHRWLPPTTEVSAEGPGGRSSLRGVLVLAASAALVGAVWIAGARGETRGWPFACYPTFANLARPTMPTLLVEVDGRPIRLEVYAAPTPETWATVWRLVGLGAAVDPSALERFWRRHHPDAVGAVRFYRAEMWVDPDRRNEAPRRVRLLHTASFTGRR